MKGPVHYIYSYEAHSWVNHPTLRRDVCSHCGLVYIRNEPTERAIRWGCNWSDHPTYLRERAARLRTT